jgi:uncharacterized integral membrane protein (TIGR00697 family)
MAATLEQKRNRVFTILCGIFITNALMAEVIGVKIFSVEGTLGLPPAHLNLFGFIMDFDLTAGVIIWPVVFITSDLINEYFGQPGVKRISYLTAALIAYAFIILMITIKLPTAGWYVESNSKDPQGNAFNINYAFVKIFSQSQRIIIGSLTAFLVGQLVDVYIFQRLRRYTGSKMLWLRATGSTLVSQFIDSFVVLYIAFSGTFPNDKIIAIGITNYIYKFLVAIALTPLVYLGHSLIDKYLGKEHAEKISEEASHQSKSFF